jgi:CcmD family protein
MRNLYLAYAVTWLIHALYLVSLGRRYARLRREFDEMRKASKN